MALARFLLLMACAMKKKFVGFRLDEDLYEFVSQFAKSKRMTVTQVLVSLILEFYEKCNEEERHENRKPQTQSKL
jgi:hypothetical protein